MNGPPVVFLALVNPKSGGNVGTQLLEKFKEILDENKIYNLSDGGPRKALEDHGHKENLRLIGEYKLYNLMEMDVNKIGLDVNLNLVFWLFLFKKRPNVKKIYLLAIPPDVSYQFLQINKYNLKNTMCF